MNAVASQSDYRDSAENHLKTAFDRSFVLGLADHLSSKRDEGKSLYAVGTCYSVPKDITLTPSSADDFLRRTHLHLLQHLAGNRRTNRPWFRAIEPEMHSFLDIPASKPKDHQAFRTHLHHSPFHHHGILAAHPRHTEKLNLLADKAHAAAFVQGCPPRCHLQSLDVQPIGATRNDLIKIADYSSYHARKFFHTAQWDEMYRAFPKSDSEYRKRLGNRKCNLSDIRKA